MQRLDFPVELARIASHAMRIELHAILLEATTAARTFTASLDRCAAYTDGYLRLAYRDGYVGAES